MTVDFGDTTVREEFREELVSEKLEAKREELNVKYSQEDPMFDQGLFKRLRAGCTQALKDLDYTKLARYSTYLRDHDFGVGAEVDEMVDNIMDSIDVSESDTYLPVEDSGVASDITVQ